MLVVAGAGNAGIGGNELVMLVMLVLIADAPKPMLSSKLMLNNTSKH
jgi:hypothetical protein